MRAIQPLPDRTSARALRAATANVKTITTTYADTITLVGNEIAVAMGENGEGYFSPRCFCQAFGINWADQYIKIKDDAVLSSTVVQSGVLAQDGKYRKMLLLPISMASAWLFTIRKVRPALQSQLNQYRLEACLALDVWFRQGMRNNVQPGKDFEVPATLADALELAAQQARELEAVKPKAAVYDATFAHADVELYSFVRTLQGVNTKDVKRRLAELGYLYRVGSQPTPYNGGGKDATYRVYSKYLGSHFTEKFSPLYGSYIISVTDLGKQLIVDLYNSGKLTMKLGYLNRKALPPASSPSSSRATALEPELCGGGGGGKGHAEF